MITAKQFGSLVEVLSTATHDRATVDPTREPWWYTTDTAISRCMNSPCAGNGNCYMDAVWKENAVQGPHFKYHAMKTCAKCRRSDNGNKRPRNQEGN